MIEENLLKAGLANIAGVDEPEEALVLVHW